MILLMLMSYLTLLVLCNEIDRSTAKYRIENEGKVTTANSTHGHQPKGSVCRSSRPVVSIRLRNNTEYMWF